LKVGAGAETNGFGSGNTEKGKKRKELGQTKEQWYGLINDKCKTGRLLAKRMHLRANVTNIYILWGREKFII
jgi:hypothetical protein